MDVSPFPYQGPLEPGHVHGRDDLIEDLVNRVTARRVTALLGPRRFGKTSLLREVSARCSELSTVWVDLYEVTSTADVAVRFDAALARASGAFASVASQLAAGVSLNLGALRIELSRPPRERPDPEIIFGSLLDVLVRSALSSPTLLILDEFSSLGAVAGAAGALRTVLQHQYRDLGLLFAGSHPSTMRALFSDRSQPFFGQADLVEAPPLSNSAVVSIITNGFASTDREAGTAPSGVVAITGGHPQRAMQLADACWRATPEGATCDQARFGLALTEVRAAVDEPMDRLLTSLDRSERSVLRLVAHSQGIYGAGADLLELSAGAATHARQVLVDRGDVVVSDDRMRIVDPLLADWLRSRLPI